MLRFKFFMKQQLTFRRFVKIVLITIEIPDGIPLLFGI